MLRKNTAQIIATMVAILLMTSCSTDASTTAAEAPCTSVAISTEIVSETEVPATETTVETTVTTVEPVEETLAETSVSTEAPVEETSTISETTPVVTTTAEEVEETKAVSIVETETTVPQDPVEGSKKEETKVVKTDKSEKKTTKVSKKKTKKPSEETRVVLDVKNIQQLPELPAGCEVTSTTIVMNYEGIKVDKMTLLSYLPMMQWPDKNDRWASPWDVFVGNPKLSYYGCYSPVIIKTVENAFEASDITSYEVVDLSGSTLEELYAQIDDGHPVIVWATMFMKESYTGRSSWTLQDGSTFHWRSNEHCLVLIGYDLEKNTVILSDPYDERGTVEYDADLFETRYEELYEQALIIRRIPKKK